MPPFINQGCSFRLAFELDTSKAYNLSSLPEICTFGFRGEGSVYICTLDMFCDDHVALASAAEVSCLEISSRTPISRQPWSVITKVHPHLSNPHLSNHLLHS